MSISLQTFTPAQAAYFLGLAAVLGACCGSFVHCVAWRMVHGGSVIKGRSYCPRCGHQLGLLDLVPVLSWLFLRGRCRHCSARVPAGYFVIEVVMAFVYVLLLWVYGLSVQTLAYMILAGILCSMMLVDLKTYTIPNVFITSGIAVWFCSVWFMTVPADVFGPGTLLAPYLGMGFLAVLVDGIIGAVVIGGGILAISLLFDHVTGRTSLGGGDVKLLFMTGLFLGLFGALFALILACVIGLLFAFVWALFDSRSSEKQKLEKEKGRERFKTKAFPFGPSIAMATIVVLLVGSRYLTWYMGFFT